MKAIILVLFGSCISFLGDLHHVLTLPFWCTLTLNQSDLYFRLLSFIFHFPSYFAVGSSDFHSGMLQSYRQLSSSSSGISLQLWSIDHNAHNAHGLFTFISPDQSFFVATVSKERIIICIIIFLPPDIIRLSVCSYSFSPCVWLKCARDGGAIGPT